MTVAWKQTALDDRAGLLARALDRAIDASDPQVYAAALYLEQVSSTTEGRPGPR